MTKWKLSAFSNAPRIADFGLRIADCGFKLLMTQDELKKRTKEFALRVIKLVESFPKTFLGRHVGGQLIRSGTSVPANYRAACRAKSNADFIAKMGIVEEEADESAFWIELAVDSALVKLDLVTDLLDETNQLVAIFVSSINTARGRTR